MSVARYLLTTCVYELDEIGKRLRVLNADTYIPGDDSVRGQEITRLAKQREASSRKNTSLSGAWLNEAHPRAGVGPDPSPQFANGGPQEIKKALEKAGVEFTNGKRPRARS